MVARAHVVAWQGYVTGELARFAEHTDGNGRIWQNTPHATRYVERRRAGSPEEYAFTGPWHVVRKHVTHEFRQWVEEYEGTERLTLSQHVERERAAATARDWLDTPAYVLDRLDEIRRLVAERDALIVEAARRGASKVAIAAASGITRQTVHTIVEAADDGTPGGAVSWGDFDAVPDTVPAAWQDAEHEHEPARVGVAGWDYVDDSEPF